MSATSANAEYLKSVQATEKANTVTISPIQATSASQIEAALERAEALIVLGDAFFRRDPWNW